MLPTPDTSHVPYERVYEPSEDSFLFLDTLSSAAESQYLQQTFSPSSSPPLVVELGTGSGVVLAFVDAHAKLLFGCDTILTAGVDVNAFACIATAATVSKAQAANPATHGLHLGSVLADLASPWRRNVVDVLLFNPPYVPTDETPSIPGSSSSSSSSSSSASAEQSSFDRDSHLLSLAYAGGPDGMRTTERLVCALPEILSPRGCAYVLLCAQNRPEEVKDRIRAFGPRWRAETVGSSGKTAGWEKLQIVRIWREVKGSA